MSLLAALLPLAALGMPERVVTFHAPGAFVAGAPYQIELSVTAKEGPVDVESWMLTAQAFTVDGLPVPGARASGSMVLPAGFTVTGRVDLATVSGFAPKRDFTLQLSPEIANVAAQKVGVVEVAPAGLDFMSLPAEQLGDWNVVFLTTSGAMRFELWPDVAPNHVRNWLDLAYGGFYEGVKFHRCIEGFMIQGGDPNTKDKDPSTWGQGGGPRRLEAEFNERKHERGVLSMARATDPNSASSQFFVCHAAAPSLDRQYTAFGKLLEGYDVLDAIVTAPGRQTSSGICPVPYQVIERALVVKAAPKEVAK